MYNPIDDGCSCSLEGVFDSRLDEVCHLPRMRFGGGGRRGGGRSKKRRIINSNQRSGGEWGIIALSVSYQIFSFIFHRNDCYFKCLRAPALADFRLIPPLYLWWIWRIVSSGKNRLISSILPPRSARAAPDADDILANCAWIPRLRRSLILSF